MDRCSFESKKIVETIVFMFSDEIHDFCDVMLNEFL